MKFSALLAGAVAVLGFSVITAQAAPVGLQLTLVVDQVNQTWAAYGQITGDTTQTLGLAGTEFDVVPTGDIQIVDTVDSPTNNDMPNGFFSSGSNHFQTGFVLFISSGNQGLGIQGSQNVNVQTNTHFPGVDSIVRGVGLLATTSNGATFSDPALLADGTYTGTLGALTISGLTVNTSFLPATLPAGSTSGTPYTVFIPNYVTPATVVIGTETVPEPASLSLLGLGAVALIARRRKAKA